MNNNNQSVRLCRLHLIFIVGIIIFLACQPNDTEDIQPDIDTFFKVYHTFLEWSQADSLQMADRHVLMDSALKQYNMKPAQFDTTLSYLEDNPTVFLEFLQQLNDSLENRD